MKKVLLALSCATILFTTSCSKLMDKHEKEEQKETINLNYTLKAGETLTYTLPTNNSDDAYAITVAPTNAASSALANDVYTYTMPAEINAETFTDHVTIANVEETHNGTEHNGIATGGCMGGGSNASNEPKHHDKDNDEDEVEIERTINIHITATGTSVGKVGLAK
jgi:hypothetical protein